MTDRVVFGTVDLPDTPLAPKLLDRFVAGGGRALDVANVYRGGEAATAVGKWLAARPADGLVVYAKGCHPPNCSPDLVESEDVFILHRDAPSLPVAAFADPLLELAAADRIGGFGVSNWTVPRLLELRSYVGEDRRLAFSNHFSLAEMAFAPWEGCLAVSKRELLGLADANVEALAWSSLARGFFAGRDDPSWDLPANRERRGRAAELAERRGVSTPALALAYVLHQPDYVMPVVGTRSEAHLDEALAAARIPLTAEELAWLETG